MTKRSYKIPKFKSDVETATFWDTHDSTHYLSQTKPAFLKFPKPAHKVVIELKEKQWRILQNLAHRKKVSFNHLLEKLISKELVTSNT